MSSPPKSILNDLYAFLKWPRRQIARVPLTLEAFIRLVGVHYLFLLGAVLILSLGTFLFDIEQLEHSIENLLKDSSPLQFLFMLAGLAPVLEELVFRFPLRFRRGSFFILLLVSSLLCYLISAQYWPPLHELIPADQPDDVNEILKKINFSAAGITGLWFVIGLFFILVMSMSNAFLSKTGRFVDSIFPYIFYITAMIFGYVHFTNFTGEMKWFWIPFLIMPQFMMGLVMGYARLRFGMTANILLHAVNNLIPGLFMLAFMGME